jgi:coenzyme F420-0:L-glutamate ligase/coenzyme F420-1:gamma-L-glutamate ligase
MLTVFPVLGIPEVQRGDDLGALLADALVKNHLHPQNGDVLVVKQKAVSKAEGRLVKLASIRASSKARKLALEMRKEPALVELVLRESRRIVKTGHGVIIAETKRGLVCANAGVDRSNVKAGYVALLPLDPDESARKLRRYIRRRFGTSPAVIVTDTFGRPWRKGQTDVAIGCAGIHPLYSYRGRKDRNGYELRVTEPAVVDELAGAAELVVGKLTGVPLALVRGAKFTPSDVGISPIVIPPEKDLFR